MKAREIDRETCRQTASALLFVVLELHPDHLSLPELIEKFASEGSRKRQKEEAAIEQIVPRLEGDGLLHTKDGRIAPTSAAVLFSELLI